VRKRDEPSTQPIALRAEALADKAASGPHNPPTHCPGRVACSRLPRNGCNRRSPASCAPSLTGLTRYENVLDDGFTIGPDRLGCTQRHRSWRVIVTENIMAEKQAAGAGISREQLIAALNEDLAREYQAIIAYVVYSQVLKGAEYMNIAGELEIHAAEELGHALIISKQIDYLGGMPTVTPKPVKTSENAKDMLRFDLESETETIRNYRERVRQCEALGEYAMAEHIRTILVNEQDHQIALATALGEDIPEISLPK
jgi:bacterioferritin